MPTPARRKQPRNPGAVALVTLLALVAVALILLNNQVFVVRQVTVEGNRYVSAQEVAASAGIQIGDGMFSLDTAQIRDGINQNRYLHYVGMRRDFPSRVVLTVTEHSPRAAMMWLGMLILLSEDGVVLEQTAQVDMDLNVPMITGMQVASVRVGRPIVLSTAGQFDALSAVLTALDAQGALLEISELNVAHLDNLYLVTHDGLQVTLGSEELLCEKVTLMLSVLPRLRELSDVRGGMLDVTTAKTADYHPKR